MPFGLSNDNLGSAIILGSAVVIGDWIIQRRRKRKGK